MVVDRTRSQYDSHKQKKGGGELHLSILTLTLESSLPAKSFLPSRPNAITTKRRVSGSGGVSGLSLGLPTGGIRKSVLSEPNSWHSKSTEPNPEGNKISEFNTNLTVLASPLRVKNLATVNQSRREFDPRHTGGWNSLAMVSLHVVLVEERADLSVSKFHSLLRWPGLFRKLFQSHTTNPRCGL